MESATTTRARFSGRLGRAAALTLNAYKKLASTATAMPIPATKMPEGAVTGDDMRCSPYRNRNAAARSAAPIPSCGSMGRILFKVSMALALFFSCVDGFDLGMFCMGRRMGGGLEHGEHAIRYRIAACGVTGTKQHREKADRLFLHCDGI